MLLFSILRFRVASRLFAFLRRRAKWFVGTNVVLRQARTADADRASLSSVPTAGCDEVTTAKPARKPATSGVTVRARFAMIDDVAVLCARDPAGIIRRGI